LHFVSLFSKLSLFLSRFLNHENLNVRVGAARFLLPTEKEEEALKVLEEASEKMGMAAFSAGNILKEHNKGTRDYWELKY
jgi:hypothetical protein